MKIGPGFIRAQQRMLTMLFVLVWFAAGLLTGESCWAQSAQPTEPASESVPTDTGGPIEPAADITIEPATDITATDITADGETGLDAIQAPPALDAAADVSAMFSEYIHQKKDPPVDPWPTERFEALNSQPAYLLIF